MLRSEDPKILVLFDKLMTIYPEDADEFKKLLYRLDRGQQEHGDDYLRRDQLFEILEEIMDSFGWAVMLYYEYPEVKDLVIGWYHDVGKFRAKFNIFKEKCEEVIKRREPRKVEITALDRVKEYMKNEINGDSPKTI